MRGLEQATKTKEASLALVQERGPKFWRGPSRTESRESLDAGAELGKHSWSAYVSERISRDQLPFCQRGQSSHDSKSSRMVFWVSLNSMFLIPGVRDPEKRKQQLLARAPWAAAGVEPCAMPGWCTGGDGGCDAKH